MSDTPLGPIDEGGTVAAQRDVLLAAMDSLAFDSFGDGRVAVTVHGVDVAHLAFFVDGRMTVTAWDGRGEVGHVGRTIPTPEPDREDRT